MGAIKPTVIVATPQFWNLIYSEYKNLVGDTTGKDKTQILNIEHRAKQRLKEALGGHVRKVRSTGAPISQTLMGFLRK